MTPRPLARRATALVAGAAALAALTACSAPSTGTASVGRAGAAPSATTPAPGTSAAGPAASPSAATSTGNAAPATLSSYAGLSWRQSPGSPAVTLTTLPGGQISFMRMDPTRLRFRFVPGYQVPEGSPATAADRNPSTWVPRMVAAFDSGYKLSDHVGGYYYLGRTVVPLRAGLASLVVHTDGTLAIGVWGRDISMTPDTLVVRQNLRPLVVDGVSQASPSDGPRTWGIANGNRPLANRSALGRLPDGSFVFVYGHLVTADTLARALVGIGVREAIMLDMNISWPTGFVYARVGSHVVGQRINRYTVRPPSTYLQRFKKDFIAVEGI